MNSFDRCPPSPGDDPRPAQLQPRDDGEHDGVELPLRRVEVGDLEHHGEGEEPDASDVLAGLGEVGGGDELREGVGQDRGLDEGGAEPRIPELGLKRKRSSERQASVRVVLGGGVKGDNRQRMYICQSSVCSVCRATAWQRDYQTGG